MNSFKMAMIPTPTNERPALLSQHSDIIIASGSLLRTTLQCRELLSSLTFFVALRSYLIAQHFVLLSKFVAIQAAVASKSLILHTAKGSIDVAQIVWNSSGIKRLRKKLELEFFTFILGGGNSLFLMMFWPGWCFLGAMIIILCCSCTG